MIMYGFSVFDGAVGAYLPMFFARSKGEAVRSFTSAVQDSAHQFGKHKGDYALYLIGSFDDGSGIFDSDAPQRVISAVEVGVE